MDITTVIINFRTPDLLETAVKSFRRVYPDIRLLIIDNGSGSESVELINRLAQESNDFVDAVFLEENIFHGPAMDLAIRSYVKTEYVFFLDSDTETKKPGFLEEMTRFLEKDNSLYGIGRVEKVNKRGFKDPQGASILLSPYMMIKCALYKKYSPFIHHGQPTMYNFNDAISDGLKLHNYNIEDYIFHHWRGTASRFGYRLGWRGKLDYILNKLGF